MSFFAGTLFTLHSGIGRCVTDGRNLNVNVEELAQKRLMGRFSSEVWTAVRVLCCALHSLDGL